MTLEVNPTDKFLSGVFHSFTIISDEGLPQGEVSIDGTEVPHRVIALADPKYKISFKVPGDSVGKELNVKISTVLSSVEEKHEITAE